ncbi:LTA synthase family protein [Burkholderia thailandensis]|uniref:LTA synthase family protein n=1 Tax=Burkholderia thailandensis TaxID=57975 RepID=UPI000517B23E|nr:LTA synthase family protein [Burkholderia thailandensis]AIT20110.1 sulfatase family protein [Burkholderia thailandensis E254]MBS2127805.1 LTA synthase family protein [Burkholderia thailandensis]MCS6510752.1 LTA synthase family protein [Burkholderia thailandensis]MCS6517796.1 LTA synthase family protein [Burkholderia thailandensis]MUV22167.1 sulfatase-like hydrolase/transferase [Burkholderia thailandensis]
MSGGLALIFAIAAALSFALDALATPRAPWRRPIAAAALHVLAFAFVASCVLLVTARVLFSAFVAVALVGLMAVVSNAKHESLREPFVFTDLSLFSQLFSHPRLYLPFLSAGKVAAIAAGVALLAAGYAAETPLAPRPCAAAAAAVLACFACGCALARRLALTLDASADQRRHGFFATFVAYLLNGLRPATLRAFERAAAASPFADGRAAAFPDVIVIQSESFFDVRRAAAGIEPSLFAHFDRARRESAFYGELAVPAWGANTMRTEFAMLTGLASERLGYARFYPYAFLRRACDSLAGWFRRGGYRTVAIHPYYADFFGRDRVFPLMHFERFLDIRHFADAPRAGPYVADAAVADALIAELDAPRAKPLFAFAMTMENHGPLHLEAVEPGESRARHALGDGDEWRDLTVYLRHVANADAMIGRLLEHLRARRRDTVVCFYGDHVPALPHVFGKLGVAPERSDYFIWRNFGAPDARRRDARVEELGLILLRATEAQEASSPAANASEKTTQR